MVTMNDKCSICGADAVAVLDLDTDHPEPRCEAHMPEDFKRAFAFARSDSGGPHTCIVCGSRAEVGKINEGALVWYCREHADKEGRTGLDRLDR